jgi:hypothetical protein
MTMRLPRTFAAAATIVVGLASAAGAATPSQIVQRHVDSMKRAQLPQIMADYAKDTVVVTPKGLVAGQTPADAPGVFSGQTQARRVFTTLTDATHLPGIKAMETSIEPAGADGAILHWVQFKGQPQQASGKDVFIVRGDKIVFQAIIPD